MTSIILSDRLTQMVINVCTCVIYSHQDFGEDGSLTLMLENFLRGLLARSFSDSKEVILGQKLLE